VRIQSEGRISTRHRAEESRERERAEDDAVEIIRKGSSAWWRVVIRRVVSRVVEWAVDHACVTYGDIAELHPGPCGRCVGKAVKGPEGGVH
jgi:alkylated DNA nucleotide flippase Atl1